MKQGRRKVIIPGCVSYSHNRIDKASGGILTSVTKSESPFCVQVEEGWEDNEYILTRHSQFQPPINVLNIYGQQECRVSKDIVERHWNEVLYVMSKLESRNKLLIAIGDANRSVGNASTNNDPKVSFGGEMVLALLDSGK